MNNLTKKEYQKLLEGSTVNGEPIKVTDAGTAIINEYRRQYMYSKPQQKSKPRNGTPVNHKKKH